MAAVFKTQVKGKDEINISKILDLFRKRWYYIAASLIMAFIACKLYLRYTSPIYLAVAKVKIEDEGTFQNLSLNIMLLQSKM